MLKFAVRTQRCRNKANDIIIKMLTFLTLVAMTPPLHFEFFLVSEFFQVPDEYALDFFYTFSIVSSDIKGEVSSRRRHVARAEWEGGEPAGSRILRRSEERRVGKDGGRTCRCRWCP